MRKTKSCKILEWKNVDYLQNHPTDNMGKNHLFGNTEWKNSEAIFYSTALTLSPKKTGFKPKILHLKANIQIGGQKNNDIFRYAMSQNLPHTVVL